jgi:hypothetical protein
MPHSLLAHSCPSLLLFLPWLDTDKTHKQAWQHSFWKAIANTANQYGQAMVGALREGRNTAGVNAVGLESIDNACATVSPHAVPPQATLSSSEYTPAQARALSVNTSKYYFFAA